MNVLADIRRDAEVENPEIRPTGFKPVTFGLGIPASLLKSLSLR
jgi:hypothetical protein